MEERDAPDQIFLGSRTSLHCVLIGIAVYLDTWWSSHREQSKYLFPLRSSEKATKDCVYIALKNEWGKDSFVKAKAGKFGTHSCRKRSYTKMRRSGISKDHADLRGRWKKRRTSDRYEDTLLPYPDAHAAGALCVGGPIKYVLKRGSVVTDDWLDLNVCVNMNKNNHLDR